MQGMLSPNNEETAETNTPATQREALTLEQHMQRLQMAPSAIQAPAYEEYREISQRLSLAR